MFSRREQLENELVVLRCRQGDSDAFGQLVRGWQERLWQYAYRLILSDAAAHDIVQETWCAVIKSLHRLDDVSLFPSWLYRIHHRKCIDWIRKEQRRTRRTEALPEEVRPASDRQGSHNEDLLEAAIRRLSPDRKALIGLRYKEGFSTEQIAEILKIPKGTVQSRLHRTITELRTLVEQESHE
jgi:RNA polymerase sigma-70 factor (ECF subfamily)